jgi:hypothetical protein
MVIVKESPVKNEVDPSKLTAITAFSEFSVGDAGTIQDIELDERAVLVTIIVEVLNEKRQEHVMLHCGKFEPKIVTIIPPELLLSTGEILNNIGVARKDEDEDDDDAS